MLPGPTDTLHSLLWDKNLFNEVPFPRLGIVDI